MIPVGNGLEPLDEYYLWCDHRSAREAALITNTARQCGLDAIDWCGGTYSSEWGFAKLLHWLRHNPDKRSRLVTAFEHCDMLTATLCGYTDPAQAPRSICAMGHKWMWNPDLGGLPSEEFLQSVDPLLSGIRAKLQGRYATSDQIAGPALAALGSGARTASRNPDSRRRLRRTLGCDRRRCPERRRGECSGNLHLHYRRRRAGED